MNIANLTPAERMRASALIGLIVVVLFFAVHMLLGAIAPKGSVAPRKAVAANAAAATAASAQSAQTTAGPSATGESFPTAKALSSSSSEAPEPDVKIPDPFRPDVVPVKAADSRPIPPQAGPKVELLPNSQPLPPLGLGPALSSGSGGTFEPAKAPDPKPEIRVVGIVHAQPSVATLEVKGRTTLFHPGDAIARGWRLQSVDSGGVRIRHDNSLIPVRVGCAINEPEGKNQ